MLVLALIIIRRSFTTIRQAKGFGRQGNREAHGRTLHKAFPG
jgi:hypothetical protein